MSGFVKVTRVRLIDFAEYGDLGSLNLKKYDQLAEIDKIRSISRDIIKVNATETHANFESLAEVYKVCILKFVYCKLLIDFSHTEAAVQKCSSEKLF